MLLWEGYRRHIRRHTGPGSLFAPRQTDRQKDITLSSVCFEGSQPSVLYGRALPTAF